MEDTLLVALLFGGQMLILGIVGEGQQVGGKQTIYFDKKIMSYCRHKNKLFRWEMPASARSLSW